MYQKTIPDSASRNRGQNVVGTSCN